MILRFLILILIFSQTACTYYFGKNKLLTGHNFDKTFKGNVFENSYRTITDFSPEHPIIDYYARRPVPDWYEHGKVSAPRIILAKLIQGIEIEEINQYLLSSKPRGRSGTSWALNPKGDYDFTEIPLLILLYHFKDKPEIIYPETQEHIVHVLLTHSGNKRALKTPRTLSIMRETENHILMGEISRYLKNQWVFNQSGENEFNNHENGMEAWLINHLEGIFKGGFFEFNSLPYSGYSITAILTLHAFTESKNIRIAAEKLLNQLVLEYSYGSLNLRRYPPFRRQLHRESLQTFNSDPMTALANMWISLVYETEPPRKNYGLFQFTFPALVLKYRPHTNLLDRVLENTEKYYVSFGHGHKSTPEIYSGGNAYLLSSGGAQRGEVSQIVARPITLFLEDGVNHIDSCFHIRGNGNMKLWNNTGVFQDFACGNSPVHIPPQYTPLWEQSNWKIFETPRENLYVITYSSENIGLIFMAEDNTKPPREIFEKLISQNQNFDLHTQAITWNSDTITYAVNSPKRFEVIREVNGIAFGRKLSEFERFEKIEQTLKLKDDITLGF